MIECGKCNQVQDDKEFYCGVRKNKKCRTCLNEERRIYRAKNPEKTAIWDKKKYIRYYKRDHITVTEAICSICKILKKSEEFPIARGKPKGIAAKCKNCTVDYARKWQAENPALHIYRYSRCADKRREQETSGPEVFDKLINLPCHYCQFNPSKGVDRIDNGIGHVESNMLPCCVWCNTVRNDIFTVDEMKNTLGPAVKLIREKRQNV